MNPALAASGSGGLAGAVVVIVNAILEHLLGHPLPADVVAAEVTLVTALAGVGAHYLTRVVPPAPAASEPKQEPAAPAAA